MSESQNNVTRSNLAVLEVTGKRNRQDDQFEVKTELSGRKIMRTELKTTQFSNGRESPELIENYSAHGIKCSEQTAKLAERNVNLPQQAQQLAECNGETVNSGVAEGEFAEQLQNSGTAGANGKSVEQSEEDWDGGQSEEDWDTEQLENNSTEQPWKNCGAEQQLENEHIGRPGNESVEREAEQSEFQTSDRIKRLKDYQDRLNEIKDSQAWQKELENYRVLIDEIEDIQDSMDFYKDLHARSDRKMVEIKKEMAMSNAKNKAVKDYLENLLNLNKKKSSLDYIQLVNAFVPPTRKIGEDTSADAMLSHFDENSIKISDLANVKIEIEQREKDIIDDDENAASLIGDDKDGTKHNAFLGKIGWTSLNFKIPELQNEYDKIFSVKNHDTKFKKIGVNTLIDSNSRAGSLLLGVLKKFSETKFVYSSLNSGKNIPTKIPTNVFLAEISDLGMVKYQKKLSEAEHDPLLLNISLVAAVNMCKTDGDVASIISNIEKITYTHASKNLEDGIHHELGHFLHHLALKEALKEEIIEGDSTEEFFDNILREKFSGCNAKISNVDDNYIPLWKKIEDQVSQYAVTNAAEFVAEVFVKIMNGSWKELDSEIMDLYDELYGPRPKNPGMEEKK
jgi:hypothetical protein